jgi:hypothetical protein
VVVVPFSLLDDVLADTPAGEDALTVAHADDGLDITLHPLLHEEMSATERAALRRLLHEGVVAATALRLALQHPAGEIERQIALLDQRSYRDRAAFLVGAIEGRYAAPAERAARLPVSPFPGGDPYAAGLYGVCPTCGSRPCTSDCPVQSRPAVR